LTFRGTFDHALDAKHRLTIPARFRGTLADGVVLAPSPEIEPGAARAVAIWTPADYDTYTDSVLSGLNPRRRPRASSIASSTTTRLRPSPTPPTA
jgi:MraZ protein